MKIELKSLKLIDHEDWNYRPDNPLEFSVAAEALVGAEGHEGSEIFTFEICSPLWLQRNLKDSPLFVRHVLLINQFDEHMIKRAVSDLVARFSGQTWVEVANKLSRYMYWEFEDYR